MLPRAIGSLTLLWMLAPAQEIRGRVFDAATGEQLSRVRIQLSGGAWEGQTDGEGRFASARLLPGEYTLQISTVGYLPLKQSFTVAEGEIKNFDVALTTEVLRRTESVEVTAGPFAAEAPMAVSLAGTELRNLGTVLADDPLRAVHGLPGVTSSDDFRSEIALRGAGYERVGVYLDGILLHTPYHTVAGEPAAATLTIFNGDALDSLNLHAGAPPASFPDRTAGALDIRTREGSRSRFGVRGTVSASNVGGLLEGPLGRARRGSWLVNARKSYLQYLIDMASDEPAIAFGFTDVSGRLSYDLARKHHVSLLAIEGKSGLNREGVGDRIGNNSTAFSDYHYTLASLAWRWTPTSSALVTQRLGWMRERFENWNKERRPLARGGYGEWIWNGDGAWTWRGSNTLEFGASARRLREDSYSGRYLYVPPTLFITDAARGTGLRAGVYLQQGVDVIPRRVQLAAGGRWDRHSSSGGSAFSPRVSLSLAPWESASLQLAWGQYVQFPDMNQLYSRFGRTSLAALRASHTEASFEQRLGARMRLRAVFYDREDRDLLFRPWLEPRLTGGRVFNPPAVALWENSQRGYARGGQIFLQRRSANGFTGWVSYAYSSARVRDGVAKVSFRPDFDQRHQFTLFASQRLRPSVNLSARWLSASGLPVRGFFAGTRPDFLLSAERNRVRLPAYHRTDCRVNKVFTWDRWQLTLFVEVVNLLNHDNYRFEELISYNARTAQARLNFDKLLPVLPSAGIVVDF